MGKYWVHTIIFFILVGVAFSPLAISEDQMSPWFLGMPRTLWVGISISIGFLILIVATALRLVAEESIKAKD